MRIWLGVLCAVTVGLVVGGTIAGHRLKERETRYRAWCASVHGQVEHQIRWYDGPRLVTICNR
jgi:hypothetical protein